MYPGVICSAVHAATRCAFAITTLHPGSNLKNLVYEEGKKRGSLQMDEQGKSRALSSVQESRPKLEECFRISKSLRSQPMLFEEAGLRSSEDRANAQGLTETLVLTL